MADGPAGVLTVMSKSRYVAPEFGLSLPGREASSFMLVPRLVGPILVDPLCPVAETCEPLGLPDVEGSMATYDFILSGVDPEVSLQGAAATDAEAWREAVLFLSEMLRENPMREGGAFSLQVIVRHDGREICRVGASAH